MKVQLEKQNERWVLKREDGLTAAIDFINDKAQYHRHFSSPNKELIAKACGYQLGFRKVLDLSAGFGVDAVFLARLGFSVTAIERNELLFKVLSESWAQDKQKLKWDLNFINADSKHFLTELKVGEFESIYYDPMYPEKNKSALPPKNMQILQSLVGSDEADTDIVELALAKCSRRVIVKRPLQAPPIKPHPNLQVLGKMVRYDIYLPSNVNS